MKSVEEVGESKDQEMAGEEEVEEEGTPESKDKELEEEEEEEEEVAEMIVIN